jgi:hypothetical protein
MVALFAFKNGYRLLATSFQQLPQGIENLVVLQPAAGRRKLAALKRIAIFDNLYASRETRGEAPCAPVIQRKAIQ